MRTCSSSERETAAPTVSSDRTCGPCPAGHSCDGSATATPCNAGYAAAAGSGVCSICSAGYYATAVSASCSPCASGTFSAAGATSAQSCVAWRTCPAGQGQKTAGSATANRVCEACVSGAQGTWSGTNDGAACAPLTVCKQGEWESTKPTVSSDRGCSTHLAACPQGQYTFAAPTGTSDRVCRDVLQCDTSTEYETRAPSQSSNRACAACPAGHACDGSATVTPCAAGYSAALGVGICTQCNAGYAAPAASAQRRGCLSQCCTAVHYLFSAGRKGRYRPFAGARLRAPIACPCDPRVLI